MQLNTLTPPLSETRVIKENAFKRVRLLRDQRDVLCIGKRYSGHAEEHLLTNAQYVRDVLEFFGQRFAGIVRVPTCYGVDEENYEVYIEYLPMLPNASLFHLSTLKAARKFFETCYGIREKCGVLRGMKHSMYYTGLMKKMLDDGFPVAAGLKGDLWQNLCTKDDEVILADIDSAALEPLGLSEFIMYAELVGSFKVEGLTYKIGLRDLQPVALRYLSVDQAQALTTLTLEIFAKRMGHLKKSALRLKLRIAERALRDACIA